MPTIPQLPAAAPLTGAEYVPISQNGTAVHTTVGAVAALGGGGTAAIPAAPGQLLGGSGSPGTATAITVGAGLTLSGGTLATGGTSYTLPVATTTVLGGVKQGPGATISADGTISFSYTLPIATPSVLGGVKQGTGITIGADGTISATGTAGVSTFNTRTGAITLTIADITGVTGTGSTAVANLGIGTAAMLAASSVVQTGNNLSDLVSVATARTNLGLGALATMSTLPLASLAASGAAVGQVPAWNGTAYVPSTVSGTGGAPATTGLTINGSTIPASAGTPYAMQTADYVVNVEKTTGAATSITLPSAPTLWVEYVIIDGKGDAATNPITVSAPAGATINGASTFVMNANRDAMTFRAVSATNWKIS